MQHYPKKGAGKKSGMPEKVVFLFLCGVFCNIKPVEGRLPVSLMFENDFHVSMLAQREKIK